MSTKPRSIWAWAVDDLIRAQDLDGWEQRERWDRWETRSYATEIFNADQVPPLDALLLGVTRDPEGLHVVAAGRIESLSGVSTGRLRARISPVLHLTPVPISELSRSNAESRRLTKALRSAPLRPQPLTSATAQIVLTALQTRAPELAAWLEGLDARRTETTGDDGQRLREERDAIHTGIELANLRPPFDGPLLSMTVVAPNNPTAFLSDVVFEDNEDDLIFADLRRFDTTGVLTPQSASTTVYTDGEFSLLIANVNRKPIEHLLGVDLLYWDKAANSFTMLQYKRLTRTHSRSAEGSETKWQYNRRDELDAQLKKMARIARGTAENAGDWRLTPSPFWFKFVRTDAFHPGDPDVLRGMYVPADYLRLGLEKDAFTGPNGGFSMRYDNTRYLTRDPFIELVRRHFTGSTGQASTQILDLIAEQPTNRELLVVAKSKAIG